MEIQNKFAEKLSKKAWIIPVLFGLMCALLAGAVAVIEMLDYYNANYGFSIGAEIVSMMIAIVIVAPILPAYKRQGPQVFMFVVLLTMGCFLCFLNITMMCLDEANMPLLLKIQSVLVFFVEALFTCSYWLYMSHTLKSKKNVTAVFDVIAVILLAVFLVLPFVNFFTPLYFYIDENGRYGYADMWWLSYIYLGLIFLFATISLFLSKEKMRNKIVVVVFLGVPIFGVLAAWGEDGLSVIYPGMMISLVLVYSLLSYDNEKHLYAKSKELNLATKIQMDALPNKFPAFPDHKEFDIYALMHPAKEVGGDFYDFFLIDNDHLGVVIADVSDKGVPSALFMMQSKIILQNYALMGLSPKEVLSKTNNQLCSSRQQKLFVTVWFAILDLQTGMLTAANGGHEFPIIKKPNGDFEIFKDEHDLVVGFVNGVPYNEYQIQLEKGSKFFVYTDGIPECEGSAGQFTLNRAVTTLNKYKDNAPEEICKSMLGELQTFMGSNDQFDDITMVCVEYKGREAS